MKRAIRVFLLVAGTAQLIGACAFFVQLPLATALWPFPNTTPLTFIFVASIFAAAAASQLWAAGTENYGAMAGIGLDYAAIFGALTVIAIGLDNVDQTTKIVFAAASAATAIFGIALFVWASRIPIDPDPPQPSLVRWSFVVFVVGLFVVGGLVVSGTANVIPWSITPQLAAVVGWMFIGAALYFVYGLLRPSWLNSCGQLLGFLAYDVVLIVPFLTRLPTTPAQFLVNLTIYTAVVLYSAALAIYFLLLNSRTRRAAWLRRG